MRILFVIAFALVTGFAFTSCGSSSGPATFCDTTCMKDTMKFSKDNHPLKPYVYISASNCKADTIIWSYNGMGVNRKMDIIGLVGANIPFNKGNVRCNIYDTSYAWLLFNDCSDGRGYSVKIPFNKTASLGRKNSAINSIDPKYAVADGLFAYTDRGNILVEDMATGKTAMMTFGQELTINYHAIHETIDSVNVTPTRIWAKVKVKEEWKELEKKIELK